MFEWYKNALTAQEQADDLFNEIASFHFTGGVFPTKIWYDYEMDTKPGTEPNVWAPIDYFIERWKVGRKTDSIWTQANKKRVNGWQVVTDYLGVDINTRQPKHRYWPQYTKNWLECMKQAECDDNNPIDLKKSDKDHLPDSCRYALVGMRNLEQEAIEISQKVNQYNRQRENRSWEEY